MMKRRSIERAPAGGCLVETEPAVKQQRITRSVTRRVNAERRSEVFERVVAPVIASGFLQWHEANNLGMVCRGCNAIWNDQKENYVGWRFLLEELNAMNCTNRCCNCEQDVLLKANRRYCSIERWNRESAKRKPDFHGVIDLVMSSGVLTWREKGGIRKISKTTYKVHKLQCTCRPHERTTTHIMPFLDYDPRYADDYNEWSDYKKCRALVKYTAWMTRNLHSFYDFNRVTEGSQLPPGLGSWTWFDIQMVTLQRACPRRYCLVMNMVSLFIAQGELQRSPPKWYASAFLGEAHDPGRSSSYEECLGSGISEYCLPATDDVLCRFLRKKCYPSEEVQEMLGPLVKPLSIFSPFFSMVPLDENAEAELPKNLEVLTDDLIDNMSLHFFCTIS